MGTLPTLSMEPSSFTVVQCLLEEQSSIVVLVDTHSLDQPPQLVKPVGAGQSLLCVHVSPHSPQSYRASMYIHSDTMTVFIFLEVSSMILVYFQFN